MMSRDELSGQLHKAMMSRDELLLRVKLAMQRAQRLCVSTVRLVSGILGVSE